MELFDKMLNISSKDTEETIKSVIDETKDELKNLDIERMCKVYSGLVYTKLKQKNVICRLVDTASYGNNYSHVFVIALDNKNNFLIDLTYGQFSIKDKSLNKLLTDGYIFLTDDVLKKYLKDVTNGDKEFSVSDAIYGNENKRS